jgi:ribosome-binding factor A
MMATRSERVQEAIRQEISVILQNEIKDPRIGFLTVTGVELTKDLRYARVYFSVLGEDKEKHLALKGLNSAKGYIKGLLSDKIKLRFMPEIEFKVDDTMERTKILGEIFNRIDKERKADAKGDRGDTEA